MTTNIKVAVLGSTKGTDLKYILQEIDSRRLKGIQIEFVLSNRQKAGILDLARDYHLKTIYLPGKDKTREEYDQEVSKLLEDHQVELVLLIGYMKLMSDQFVQKWLNKVVNIHPSILPAFEGGMDLNIHQAVLDRGCKVTGCSLIFIDQGADTGPIIDQRIVLIDRDETVESLKMKVQKTEGEVLVKFLENWRDRKIEVQDKKVFIKN